MLLDVSMPKMDGLQALPRVRELSPDTRVVMYTGFDEQGLANQARELGAAAYVEKSAPLDELADRLASVVDGAGTRRTPAPPPYDDDTADVAASDTVLREHLERFHEVFEEAAIGMATMTLSGYIVRANRAFAELVGRSVDELVGAAYDTLAVGAERIDVAGEIAALDPAQPVLHLAHDVVDGERRHVEATIAPIRDSRGRPLYLFLQLQDVTARRAAAEELRQSEERFRLLVEAVEDYAIFMLDPDGVIVSWNAGAQRIKGYTAHEAIGRHFRMFYPPDKQTARHPEHELALALRDGHYEEEGWRTRKDGTEFWANVVITAVHDAAGVHVGFAKVTRDTTERRRSTQERERAAAALAEANSELEVMNERLTRVAAEQSQFLAVTAHELRTPVGVLGGSADLLAEHWAELPEAERAEMFISMVASAGRLRRLLADLLTAARLDADAVEFSPQVVDVA